jgi:ATP-binding cassette subfamily C exporter for protease/lipase
MGFKAIFHKPSEDNEILSAIYGYKRIFRVIALFTAAMNVMLLAPSLYMLEVYDRVLTSRNEFTLLMLTLIVMLIYVVYAALEAVRSHTVIEMSKKLDAHLNERVYTAAFEQNLKNRGGNAGQALNDLTTLRQFVTGPSLFAFFDAPWFPFYLIVIFLFNFWLGVFATIFTFILIALAFINETVTHGPLSEANNLAVQSSNLASNNLRNAEVLEVMGMLPGIRRRWFVLHQKFMDIQALASQRAASLGAITKFLRITTQSLVLGLAAYLVLINQISPGMMIAATILLGKSLAPVEAVIGVWRQWRGVISSYERLQKLLSANPVRKVGMSLPRPEGHIFLEHVYAAAPGGQKHILRDISFKAAPGDVVGVIGPSASGKSTLAKILVGLWKPSSSCVRIDGADAYTWNKDELGEALGYVPQDIEMLPGTISENIARFIDFKSEDVIAAATTAGVHEMVLRFPQGYDTIIGDAGMVLSGGQKQRIALARAVFGKPSIVVLDEPNSNLDDSGELALVKAVIELRNRLATVIVITHRTSLLKVTNKLLLLQDGALKAFGPTQQVLNALQQEAAKAAGQSQTSNALVDNTKN